MAPILELVPFLELIPQGFGHIRPMAPILELVPFLELIPQGFGLWPPSLNSLPPQGFGHNGSYLGTFTFHDSPYLEIFSSRIRPSYIK
ncbi:hypothetical protein TIFTF001_051114 [Ficus carica]|uniref:Uncharacterized protein n=1 Tax=Ficus carica TaxID=3494 RepID=A0AA87YXK4_FICCA|nr:hypothetical protein TIFTF001_051113 [Ficus carica]GMN21394.1 hypothetical protein TIFTF001_051114 [Ficus carica]